MVKGMLIERFWALLNKMHLQRKMQNSQKKKQQCKKRNNKSDQFRTFEKYIT